VILEPVLRDVLADAIDTEINTGAGTAELKLETAADAEVATIALQNPAFVASAGGVIAAAGVPLSDASATGGTVSQASVYDRDGTKQFELTVGTSAAEIIITRTGITAGDPVNLRALTINQTSGAPIATSVSSSYAVPQSAAALDLVNTSGKIWFEWGVGPAVANQSLLLPAAAPPIGKPPTETFFSVLAFGADVTLAPATVTAEDYR